MNESIEERIVKLQKELVDAGFVNLPPEAMIHLFLTCWKEYKNKDSE